MRTFRGWWEFRFGRRDSASRIVLHGLQHTMGCAVSCVIERKCGRKKNPVAKQAPGSLKLQVLKLKCEDLIPQSGKNSHFKITNTFSGRACLQDGG